MSRAERAHRRQAEAAFRAANNLATVGSRKGTIQELAETTAHLLELVGADNRRAVSTFLHETLISSLTHTKLHKQKGHKASGGHMEALDAFAACFGASLERGGKDPEGGVASCNQPKVMAVIDEGRNLKRGVCCGIPVAPHTSVGTSLKPLVKHMGLRAKKIGSELKRVHNFVVNQRDNTKVTRKVLSCAPSTDHEQEGIIEALRQAAAIARQHDRLGSFWTKLSEHITSYADKASALCRRTPDLKGHDCARPEKVCAGGKRARSKPAAGTRRRPRRPQRRPLRSASPPASPPRAPSRAVPKLPQRAKQRRQRPAQATARAAAATRPAPAARRTARPSSPSPTPPRPVVAAAGPRNPLRRAARLPSVPPHLRPTTGRASALPARSQKAK
jgi:hypothetical protein